MRVESGFQPAVSGVVPEDSGFPPVATGVVLIESGFSPAAIRVVPEDATSERVSYRRFDDSVPWWLRAVRVCALSVLFVG